MMVQLWNHFVSEIIVWELAAAAVAVESLGDLVV